MGVEERNCKEVNYAVGKGCSSNSLYTEYGKRKYLQILQVPLLVGEEEKVFCFGQDLSTSRMNQFFCNFPSVCMLQRQKDWTTIIPDHVRGVVLLLVNIFKVGRSLKKSQRTLIMLLIIMPVVSIEATGTYILSWIHPGIRKQITSFSKSSWQILTTHKVVIPPIP